MQENDTSQAKPDTSPRSGDAEANFPTWLKVSAIAAASALAGGLAAAWFYRKTLDSLREAESGGGNPEFGIPDSETEHDI
jgi:hypothetical protein